MHFSFPDIKFREKPKPTMFMKQNAGGLEIIGYTFVKIVVYVAFIHIFSLQMVFYLRSHFFQIGPSCVKDKFLIQLFIKRIDTWESKKLMIYVLEIL